MSWHYVDDAFPEHPKWIALESNPRLWAECMALWLAAGCYCRRQSSEGFVPSTRVGRLTPLPPKRTEAAATALVEVGLWVECEGGYRFHDWEDYDWRKGEAPGARDPKDEAPVKESRRARRTSAERTRRYRERQKARESEDALVKSRDAQSVTSIVTCDASPSVTERHSGDAPSPQTPHPHVTQTQANSPRERDGKTASQSVTERDDVPQVTHQDPSVIVAEKYRVEYRERFGSVAPRLHFSDGRVSELVRMAREQAELEGAHVTSILDRFFDRFWVSETAAKLRHQPGAMQAVFPELMANKRSSVSSRGPARPRSHSEFETTTDAELEAMFG